MAVYVRCYPKYSYEIIMSEGKLKKSRSHLLINPNKDVKLQGEANKDGAEVNLESLTHILAMKPSMFEQKMIEYISRIAEVTNKPIITNRDTSTELRNQGLSVKQLRILGFEEEVIDGLSIDPVYEEEFNGTIEKTETTESDVPQRNFIKRMAETTIDVGKKITRTLNPLKVTDRVKETFSDQEKMIVDPSKPLAVLIRHKKNQSILFLLDDRGKTLVNSVLANTKPSVLVLPGENISKTLEIGKGARKVLIVNQSHKKEEILKIPKTYNSMIDHDTTYGSFKEWIEIEF